MRISDMKFLKSDMDDLYEELGESIDTFFSNPTVENKKYIRGLIKEFNHVKNILSNKIQDFWCKGE